MHEYDRLIERYEVAYEAHRAMYAKRNPPPARPQIERADRMLFIAVVGIVVTSVIVSASHTLPVFMSPLSYLPEIFRFFVAVAAFGMMELGLVSLAYVWIKSQYAENPSKKMRVGRLVRAALFLIFIVAVLSNVFHVVGQTFHMDTPFWRAFMMAISILIGVSAPVLAFICGEVLAILTVAELQRQSEIEARYQAAYDEWAEALNEAWERQKSRLGVRTSVQTTDTVVRSLSDGHGQMDTADGQNTGQGYTKRTDARDVVRAYLLDNPEALSIPVRELADKLGVGKSTVASVRREVIDSNR